MKKIIAIALILLLMAGCSPKGAKSEEEIPQSKPGLPVSEETEEMELYIGERKVPVKWESNASVEALKGLMPLTIEMSMYGGFEQVGPIGQSIARDDRQITTDYGDIVLYSGSQIVIFYGSNSWSYTKLGHIDLTKAEMTELLGKGDVTISIK